MSWVEIDAIMGPTSWLNSEVPSLISMAKPESRILLEVGMV